MTAPQFLSPFPQASEARRPGAGFLDLPPCWPLAHGGALLGGRLAYELTGPEDAPLVAVLGGISAGRHVTATEDDPSRGWWQGMAGPGRAIDTHSYRVLGLDFLGGNGLSAGPRSCPPDHAPATFPTIGTEDQARALALLLDALGARWLHAAIGASYGGMVALAFAAEHRQRLERLVVISAAERSHPRSTAWRCLQRKVVRQALARGRAAEGLALARALAMTTYRSPAELAERFGGPARRTREGFRFPVESYLEARGADFADRFDAHAFLRLSESIDLHAVEPARVTAAATLVSVTSDQLVPPEQMRALARRLSGPVELVELDSRYGHDAFLKEQEAVGELLRRSLEGAPDSGRASR